MSENVKSIGCFGFKSYLSKGTKKVSNGSMIKATL
jgi:hypothetical protein